MLKKPLEAYRNMYVNLSLPLFAFSEPMACPKYEANGMEFTLWDHISMNKDTGKSMTLNELIETIKTQYNCDVDMICKGEALIYSCFSKKDVRQRRLMMPVEAVVEEVTKIPLPKNNSFLMLSFSCSDENGDEVDLPNIYYYY